MVETKSFLNDLEIVHYGQMHAAATDTLRLQFDTLNFEINFVFDNSLDGDMIWKLENDILKISLKNAKSSNGSGVLAPWHIGAHDNRMLYISFYTRLLTDSKENSGFYLFNYIFYLGKEAEGHE